MCGVRGVACNVGVCPRPGVSGMVDTPSSARRMSYVVRFITGVRGAHAH
jgi:hypothetical protein